MSSPTSSPTLARIQIDREKAHLDKYDLVLSFTPQTSSQQLETIISILTRHKFKHLSVKNPKVANNTLLFLSYDDVLGILKQASTLNIFKKCYTRHLVESKFKLRRLLTDRETKNLDPKIKELEDTARFTFEKRKDFLFVPETVNLVNKEELPEKRGTEEENVKQAAKAISKLLQKEEDNQGMGIARLNTMGNDGKGLSYLAEEPWDSYIGLFTPSELCRIIWSLFKSIEVDITDQTLLDTFGIKTKIPTKDKHVRFLNLLKNAEILEYATPLHNQDLELGLENINNLTYYFGQNVSIYFRFMEFYTKWLVPPAIFGVLIYFLSSDKHPNLRFMLETAYGLMMMIWATLFVKFWQRKSSEICVKWHTYSAQAVIPETRYDYRGELRVNLVTGLPELYFPFQQKLLRYAKTAVAHSPIMIFAFVLLVCFLNVRGYVLPSHWIYMPSLAGFSEKGAIFDIHTPKKFIPTILQVISIVILARINKALSFISTGWENHRTQSSYNNSIIAKRFLFEVLYTFIHLVYIAFWRLDASALRIELIALFASDEIRRVVMETIIPYVKKAMFEKSQNIELKFAKNKKVESEEESLKQYVAEKLEEISLAEYDAFDDYLEMIIQFGYITLFAAAFPLSGALSLLFNGVEVLSDYFKLRKCYRRPLPQTVNGIGAWKNAIDVMSYLCIVTNCVLIAFNSTLRTVVQENLHHDAGKNEEEILTTMLILEHVMLVVVYLLRKVIRDEPFWVRIYLKRKVNPTA